MELRKYEKTNSYTAELEIAVSKEEFEAACEQAYHKNVGKITIPGFRRGKAPRKMIEKMYGASVFYEDAVNIAYPKAYSEAVDQAGIVPVDQAELDVLDIGDEGFRFKAVVTFRPEIDPGDYKSIRVSRDSSEVTDADVDAEIDRMAQRNARTEVVEREAQNGDTANIDYEGFVDDIAFEGGKGENYDLKLGSGTFIPGFEEQIIGHKAGDEFNVVVTFPTEYGNEELAGKEATFKTVLHEVHETILPAIDDEFAKDVSEFDTLAELKADTRKNLETSRVSMADRNFETAILGKLAELVKDEIPPVMFENSINEIVNDFSYRMEQQGISMEQYMKMTGSDEKSFRETFRPRAEQQVKVRLALDAIAKAEGFTATEEEVDAAYEKLATDKITVEQVRNYLSADNVRADVVTDKVIVLLKEIAAQPVEDAPAAQEVPAAE